MAALRCWPKFGKKETQMEKMVTSDLVTMYEPTLPWNRWVREPVAADPKQGIAALAGEERPESERLKVELTWPTIEESNRLSESGSSSAISLAYAKFCITGIINPGVAGITARNGSELLAIRSKGRRKAWQLALNVGAYTFAQSFLTEEEEKN
jgi:hypothetical protein